MMNGRHRCGMRHQQPRQRQDDHEEDREGRGREEHVGGARLPGSASGRESARPNLAGDGVRPHRAGEPMAAAGSHHAGPRACERVPPGEDRRSRAVSGDSRRRGYPVDMRERLGLAGRRPLILVALLAALCALGPAAGSAHAVKLTFIGDSKAAAIEFSRPRSACSRAGHTFAATSRSAAASSLPAARTRASPRRPPSRRSETTGPGSARARDRRRLQRHVRHVSRAAQPGHARRAQPRDVKGVVWVNLRAWGAAGPPRLREDQRDHRPVASSAGHSSTSPTGTHTRGASPPRGSATKAST